MCSCIHMHEHKYTKKEERGESERKKGEIGRERKKKGRPKLRVLFRVDHLSIMCKVLGSIPNTTQKKKKAFIAMP